MFKVCGYLFHNYYEEKINQILSIVHSTKNLINVFDDEVTDQQSLGYTCIIFRGGYIFKIIYEYCHPEEQKLLRILRSSKQLRVWSIERRSLVFQRRKLPPCPDEIPASLISCIKCLMFRIHG